MKDIRVKISSKTSMVYPDRYTLGVDGENLQGNIVFYFEDEFKDGTARLEYAIKGQKYLQILTKEEETYIIPIRSVLTKKGEILMQLVVVEPTNSYRLTEDTEIVIGKTYFTRVGEEEPYTYEIVENPVAEDLPTYYEMYDIPIFKSNVFKEYCNESINAQEEQPSDYPSWVEIISTKLAELDQAIEEANTLDIDAQRVEDGVEITITKKDGTPVEVKVNDGENGADGQDAKINGYNTLNIVAGENIEIVQEEETLTINATGGSGGGNVDDVLVNGVSVVTNKIANVSVPTKTSDITNDSDFVEDANYVHTDNNFTTLEKTKLEGLENYDDTEVRNLISTETTNRQNADNGLQSQIDAITSASDVVDVVGTYAELQAYDTTLLKNNDIVKVLVDESKSDAITYYRWVITDNVGAWDYVGSQGPFYTKSESDTLLNNKQDTLIAGSNITINGNTISASGLEPIIINVTSNTTVNGYQVPLLTNANIQAIYNGIVAGREVVVSDATGNMHFKVNQADTDTEDIFVSFVYYDIMLLQYDTLGNITFKEIASKAYVDNAIGNALQGEY